MKNYPIKVNKCKNGSLIAQIQNEAGETLKEVYSHFPMFNENMNMFLLKKQVEYLVWLDLIEDK